MSKYMDLANAQLALDRDRENVESTARKLYTYCAALRERIARYYGTMATAEKQAAFVAQRERLRTVMDACQEYIEYAQDEGAWSNIDCAPEDGGLNALAGLEVLPGDRPAMMARLQEQARRRIAIKADPTMPPGTAALVDPTGEAKPVYVVNIGEDAAREGEEG